MDKPLPRNIGKAVCTEYKKSGRCSKFLPGAVGRCTFDHPPDIATDFKLAQCGFADKRRSKTSDLPEELDDLESMLSNSNNDAVSMKVFRKELSMIQRSMAKMKDEMQETIDGFQREAESNALDKESKAFLVKEINAAKKEASNARMAAAHMKDEITKVQQALFDAQSEAKQAAIASGSNEDMKAAIMSMDEDQSRRIGILEKRSVELDQLQKQTESSLSEIRNALNLVDSDMKAQSDKGNLAERMLKLEAKVEKVVDRIKESEDLMTANIFESDTQFEEFKVCIQDDIEKLRVAPGMQLQAENDRLKKKLTDLNDETHAVQMQSMKQFESSTGASEAINKVDSDMKKKYQGTLDQLQELGVSCMDANLAAKESLAAVSELGTEMRKSVERVASELTRIETKVYQKVLDVQASFDSLDCSLNSQANGSSSDEEAKKMTRMKARFQVQSEEISSLQQTIMALNLELQNK